MFPDDLTLPSRPVLVLAFAKSRFRGRLEGEGFEVVGCGTIADAQRGCPLYRPAGIVIEAAGVKDVVGLVARLRAACGESCPHVVVFGEEPVDGADLVIGEPWDGTTVRVLLGSARGGSLPPRNGAWTLPPSSDPSSAGLSYPPHSGPVVRALSQPPDSLRPTGIELTLLLEVVGHVVDRAMAESLVRRALRRSDMTYVPSDRQVLEAFVHGPLTVELAARMEESTVEEVTRELRTTFGFDGEPRSSAPAPSSAPGSRRSGHTSGTYRVVGAEPEEILPLAVVIAATTVDGPERRLRRLVEDVVVLPAPFAPAEAVVRGGVLVVVDGDDCDGRALAGELRLRGYEGPLLVLLDGSAMPRNAEPVHGWLELGWPASRPRLRRALQRAATELDGPPPHAGSGSR